MTLRIPTNVSSALSAPPRLGRLWRRSPMLRFRYRAWPCGVYAWDAFDRQALCCTGTIANKQGWLIFNRVVDISRSHSQEQVQRDLHKLTWKRGGAFLSLLQKPATRQTYSSVSPANLASPKTCPTTYFFHPSHIKSYAVCILLVKPTLPGECRLQLAFPSSCEPADHLVLPSASLSRALLPETPQYTRDQPPERFLCPLFHWCESSYIYC